MALLRQSDGSIAVIVRAMGVWGQVQRSFLAELARSLT